MDDNQSSFFDRFYNCASSEEVNFEHVRHKCEPGQKSFVSGLFEKFTKRSSDDTKSRDGQVATPKSKSELDDNDNANRDQKPEVDSPDGMADSRPRCFIKEQNPLAPPCCEMKSVNYDDDEDDGSACPPEGYPQNPRVPSCGCDRCRKSGYHGRCCDRRTYVQQSAERPPILERA